MAQWNGILEFIEVARCGSFTRAADKLNLSTSQVSKRISKLEDRLQTRLLHRTTRRLRLTDVGERYFQQCSESMNALQDAEAHILEQQKEALGRLKINVAGSFQERFLVPFLAEFCKIHPKLSIDLHFSDKSVDLISEGFDIAVAPGPLEDSTLIAKRLGEIYNVLVASPEYLESRGCPKSLDQLKAFNCLIGTEDVWSFSDGLSRRDIKVSGQWHSENSNALLSAARCGLGIAQLPFFAVQAEIENGTLMEIIADWNQLRTEVWIIFPDNRHLPFKVRSFIDFLLDKIALLQSDPMQIFQRPDNKQL